MKKDRWYLFGKYNGTWEELFECEDEDDAMKQLACYDENEPNYLHKIVKKTENNL